MRVLTWFLPASRARGKFHGIEMDTTALVRMLCSLLRRERMPAPGRIRLTKLLYLLDVEAKRVLGKRATDLDWIYYHYGPYAFELEPRLEEAGFSTDELDLPGGGRIRALRVAEASASDFTGTDPNIKSLALSIVKAWGDADLNRLLNYVYFETEPMAGAKRGARLSFDNVRALPITKDVHWGPKPETKSKLLELRARLADKLERRLGIAQREHPSSSLRQNLAIWDSEEPSSVPLEGGIVDLPPDGGLPPHG